MTARPGLNEWVPVLVLQAFFLAMALPGLDLPFDSMHFVRQNQTFDVARHVFHDGWSAVITPRASFSQLSEPDSIFSPITIPNPRETIIHLEVPFHGIFGWPLARLFPDHERAAVRLVSIAFTLLSIALLYGLLRFRLEPAPALAGTALWTTAPLILHFGHLPVPDILATTGIAAAFLFALHGRLAASSAAFLFAVLAKLSIIIYGLPVFVALLVAKDCRSPARLASLLLAWGAAPLLALAGWVSLGLHNPPGSWLVFGGYHPGDYGPIHLAELMHPAFYGLPLLFVFPFGIGILGIIGLLFALGTGLPPINPWIKASIALALVVNYISEEIAWREPQYTLPILLWLVIIASFGFARLLERTRSSSRRRVALGVLLAAHLAVVWMSVGFLEASRVPNLADIEAAGRLTPSDARIVVYSDTASASPSVWLDRNTLKLDPLNHPGPVELDALSRQFADFQTAGFHYLMLIDMQKQHSLHPFGMGRLPYATSYTDASSPIRRFFDGKFREIFEGDHILLYDMGK